MIGTLDSQVIEKFKEFQKKTGKYSDLDIENVEFEREVLNNLIDIFDSQRVPLSTTERNKRKGKYPYYGASGIIDYIDDFIFDGEYLIISEDGENLRSRKTPIAFWATGQFWVNNHAHIVLGKENILYTDYLRLFISSNKLSGFISNSISVISNSILFFCAYFLKVFLIAVRLKVEGIRDFLILLTISYLLSMLFLIRSRLSKLYSKNSTIAF